MLNSVDVLIRVEKLSPEDAVKAIVRRRNELMRALVVNYERAFFKDSSSAILKVAGMMVGVLSIQLNGPARYGWIHQSRPKLNKIDVE